jgi:hypothetical protein
MSPYHEILYFLKFSSNKNLSIEVEWITMQKMVFIYIATDL